MHEPKQKTFVDMLRACADRTTSTLPRNVERCTLQTLSHNASNDSKLKWEQLKHRRQWLYRQAIAHEQSLANDDLILYSVFNFQFFFSILYVLFSVLYKNANTTKKINYQTLLWIPLVVQWEQVYDQLWRVATAWCRQSKALEKWILLYRAKSAWDIDSRFEFDLEHEKLQKQWNSMTIKNISIE